MTREEVNKTMDEVFQDVFDDEGIHVTESTTAKDIADWDSMMHVTLCVAIERKFGIKFNMDQVNTMKNVGEMMDIVLSQVS
ncbi:MAG: acyl carrier protein [Lachnospiraceae bacterium]|nr:acyl carrier protein [Lachnospiraceae bacterium]